MNTPLDVLWYCLKQAQIEAIKKCKEIGNIPKVIEMIDKKLVNVIERHCGNKNIPGGGIVLIWGKKGRFIFITENTLRSKVNDEIGEFCEESLKEMEKDKGKSVNGHMGMYV